MITTILKVHNLIKFIILILVINMTDRVLMIKIESRWMIPHLVDIH